MRYVIVAIALLLTACAKMYVAPTGMPTATLTLAASLEQHPGAWILVQNFNNDSCEPSPNGTRLATFTTKSIQGAGDAHSGVSKSIPADRPVVFSFIYQTGAAGFTDTTSCAVTQSFMPAPGARYRAAFDMVGDKCVVLVRREDGEDPKAIASLHRVEPACNNMISG